jgi:hypothetical protein
MFAILADHEEYQTSAVLKEMKRIQTPKRGREARKKVSGNRLATVRASMRRGANLCKSLCACGFLSITVAIDVKLATCNLPAARLQMRFDIYLF